MCPRVLVALGQCPTRRRTEIACVRESVRESVSKGFCAFAPGMNVVGGETDIATVTRHEGFKWIRRKHYYDAAINRLETDHG